MSLGIHSGSNVGKLPVDPASDKSKSGAEKIKSDDSSKFSKAIDDQVSAQRGNTDSDGHVAQIVSEQFLLPDNSKGAKPADDGGSVAQTSGELDFIEDLLEPGAPFGAELVGDNVADAWPTGEIQGFNFPTENFGQLVAGTFSVLETNRVEQGSDLEQSGVAEADAVAQATESSLSDSDVLEAVSAVGESGKLEQTGIVEIDEEPPRPLGAFSSGHDAIAAFLDGGNNEGAGYVRTGGFIY